MMTPEDVWRAYDAIEARVSAPLSERMLDLAKVGEATRVLDLATGRGEPAIRAALRVGASGHVLGVDPAPSMLAVARARADREGATSLELRALDATSLSGVVEASFDVALMRWGLMFVDDPVAALREAKRATVEGGPIVIAVWVEPARVAFWQLPRDVLARQITLPPTDFAKPGMFHYGDLAVLHRDLAAAGLHVRHEEEMDVAVFEGTPEETVAYVRAFGMTKLLAELPIEGQRVWETAFLRAVEPLRVGTKIRLGGVTRIVVAASTKTTS